MLDSKDSFNRSLEIQEKLAIPIYEKIWPDCKIAEIDKLGVDCKLAKELDYSGLDKIIIYNRQRIIISQKFTSNNRYNNFGMNHSYYFWDSKKLYETGEYFRLLEAIKNGYNIPDRYVFGIINTKEVESGFKVLNMYDIRGIVQATDKGLIRCKLPHLEYGSYWKFVIYWDLKDIESFKVWSLED